MKFKWSERYKRLFEVLGKTFLMVPILAKFNLTKKVVEEKCAFNWVSAST